jgi:hypothetical protein
MQIKQFFYPKFDKNLGCYIKTLATISTSFKSSSDQKNLKKKEIKRQMQIVAEICQNRIAGKD